jgi:hypothetical protein
MSKVHLRSELLALLQLSAPNVSESKFETILRALPTSFNWNYFLERAIATKLAGYLLHYPTLAQQHYPPFVLEKIKSYQQLILLHSTFLRADILELTPQLEAQNLDYALLKGWDLHFRYGVSLKERQISDIDILIRESDLSQLEVLLQQNGYRVMRYNYKSRFHQKWLPTHAPLSAIKGGKILDIHTTAFAKDHRIELPLNLANKARIELPEGGHLWVLNEAEAQLFLAFHAIKHLEALHDFKGAQIMELKIAGIDASKLRKKEKILLEKLVAFLDRANNLELDLNKIYDAFYMYQLAGGKAPFSIKCLRIFKRLQLKTSFLKSLVLAYFDLFPSKSYLEKRFGKGRYMALNLKRLH